MLARKDTGFADFTAWALLMLLLIAVVAGPAAAQGFLTADAGGPVFQASLLDRRTGQFTFEVDIRPNGYGGVALGKDRFGDWPDLEASLRFEPPDLVTMRDGATGNYRADNVFRFSQGETYHIRMIIDTATDRYSVFVRRLADVNETTLGLGYATRTGVAALDRWGVFGDSGSIMACNPVAYASIRPPRGVWFNGVNSFIEIPDHDDFSITTTGELTVSAWFRPDTLAFPKIEGSGYANWLGKGEGYGSSGHQEWYFRIYSAGNSENRGNRISFYLFNASGGYGNGSYFQDLVTPGEWIHVVGIADAGGRTFIFKNGTLRDCDKYRSSAAGPCDALFAEISPTNGTAPLRIGTADLSSFFYGSIKEVRIWNRALSASEVASLYTGTVPRNGLVGEYLLTADVIPAGVGPSGLAYGTRWLP